MQQSQRFLRSPLSIAIVLAVSSCAVGPNFHAPELPLPSQYAASPPAADPGTQAVEIERWWRALGDPELDALVDAALQGNPSLQIALARLQEARTFEVAMTGLALPRIEAASGGGHGTGSDLTRGRAPGALTSADHTTPTGIPVDLISGFDAAWDLDLFGRYRRQMEAARYDSQAAAGARDAVQVAVIADVVRAYVDLRGYQMQSAVQDQTLRAARSLFDLVEARFERGITNELDVTLARRQLASVEADVAPLNAQIEAAQDAIEVLVGEFPEAGRQALAHRGLVPPVPDEIAPGLPIDLLRRRPDIREAEWELAGATARVGIATANLFPQLSLTAGTGVQGQGAGFRPAASKTIWSVGYSAAIPLLDFGILDAFADIADLQVREQLAFYRQSVLRAVQDVDTSLAAFRAQQLRLRSLGDAVAASQRAMTLASERYDRGLTDFLNVVDAQRQEYELEGQYATAQMNLAEQYAGVYRALGGGWEQYDGPPKIRTPQPAIVAMFRRLVQPDSGP